MHQKLVQHTPRHAAVKPTGSHAARYVPRASGPVWFLSGACAVLALLSVITVVFAHGSGSSGGAGSSHLVYIHGAADEPQYTTVSVRVPDTADTFVNYAHRNRNYAGSDRLVASDIRGSRKIVYLRFDLPQFNAAQLDSATIVLTRDLHHMAGTLRLASVSHDWHAAALTAVRRPYLGATLGKVPATRAMSSVTFDVTDHVRSGGVLSFGVKSSLHDNTVRFNSREAHAGGPILILKLRHKVPPTSTPPTPTTSPTTTAPTTAVPTDPTTTAPVTDPTDPSTSAPASSPVASDPSTPVSTDPVPTPSTSAPSTSTSTAPGTGGLVRPNCTVSAILVPSCGRWWGVAPQAYMNTPVDQGIAKLEGETNQPFDLVHAYHRNDDLFPNAAERAVALQPGRNRLLFLNWKPATDMSWAAVANGGADSRIDREAAYLKSTWQYPFFLTIWHEPENDVNATPGSGETAQDYAAMFAHVVNRLRADGVYNAITVMTYMNYLPWETKPWFNSLWPGDGVVDWVAVDSYATGGLAGYNSGDFAQMMNRSNQSFPGFYKWDMAMHGNKPLMIGEWGVFQDDSNPDGKANFYNSVGNEIQNFPNVHALVYFDMPKPPTSSQTSTSFDTSPSALSAFEALRANPQIVAPQVVYGPGGSVTG